MQYSAVILLSLALAVDALIVAFSFGLVIKTHRLRNALEIALATGAGQFIMPLLGFMLTGSICDYVADWDHWIAFSVFTILGIRVIWNAFAIKEVPAEEIPHTLSLKLLAATGLATSIDAFVAGASIYFSQNDGGGAGLMTSALIIGGVTFACALASFLAARHLHRLPARPLEAGAGLILIGLGVKILIEHTCCL